MHHSRLCSIIIDCNTYDLDGAVAFWSSALGRPINLEKSGDLEKYRALETPPGQIKCEVQKVDHPSRVHIDIETDDIEVEVVRLSRLGAKEVQRIRRWVVMEAPTGQRFCIVPPQLPDFPKNANRWD
ncbi:MAG TPA: VOC family protein [Gammaproteobacteria bacterium]|nr:VOC family protein [Gammaproteobacteria bacterium]